MGTASQDSRRGPLIDVALGEYVLPNASNLRRKRARAVAQPFSPRIVPPSCLRAVKINDVGCRRKYVSVRIVDQQSPTLLTDP
jgi:hypothetical protein